MMREDRSYGIIPLKKTPKGWKTLMVQHRSDFWAFPKGHPEPGETPKQAAERELFEETGLNPVKYLSDEMLKEQYFFKHEGVLIKKEVFYFIAEVEGKVVIQEEEVMAAKWIEMDKAEEFATFKEAKNLCKQVQNILD